MSSVLAIAAVASLASSSVAQSFTIFAVAPAQVNPGDTYTVEFYGQVSGGSFVDGVSAIARFGISALGTGDIAGVAFDTGVSFTLVTETGPIVGPNLHNVVGGQLPNVFGLNPFIMLDNPLHLFSFEVTAGGPGIITYTPGEPHPDGALSYYPVSTAGTSVDNNAPGATLNLIGAETVVIPAPASIALLGLGALAARRRRSSLTLDN